MAPVPAAVPVQVDAHTKRTMLHMSTAESGPRSRTQVAKEFAYSVASEAVPTALVPKEVEVAPKIETQH